MKKMNSAALQQRGLIVKFHSFLKFASAALASVILASCGGGGASSTPTGGDFSLTPTEGTFYAGAVGTLSLLGGRPPYALNSSEPSVMPLPATFNGHTLEVIPNNPGTIDAGLAPEAVPIRTVTISARDSLGQAATAQIHVAHNFLTGYNAFFSPTNCPSGAQACSGGDTLVRFDTVTNGLRYGNRPFRVQIVRGSCHLADPISGTNQLSDIITTATDHEGKLLAVISCPTGIASQVGVIRLIDVGTGASTEYAFTISEASATQNLNVIPNSLTFTGPDTTHCGTGAADIFVFDGLPPYTAVSSSSAVILTSADTPSGVTPAISRSQPGRFTVTLTNPFQCVDTTVIVTDARGGRATVNVKSETGTGTPPPTALSVTPNSINLGCGQAASVLVIGGAGSYSTASTDPNLSMAVSGNTLTITRAGTGAAPPPGTVNVASSVNVTDGTGISVITVTNPATCP
jgi:hypothetical protein